MGKIRVVPIFKFSGKQADHERNSRDMGIQNFFFAHNHTMHSQVKTCIVSYICNENPLKEADNRTMSKTYVKYSTSH